MANPSGAAGAVPGLGELEALFRARQPVAEPPTRSGTKVAAVFVLFAACEGGPGILLTRRSQKVEHHKGEVAFPGGVEEPGDADPLDTARRETVEEMGVRPEDIEPWGALSPLATATGFLVLPFTGRLAHPDRMSPSADEVSEAFYVPVSTLLDPGCVRDISMLEGDELKRERAYACGGRVIWGATARILSEVAGIIDSGASAGQT